MNWKIIERETEKPGSDTVCQNRIAYRLSYGSVGLGIVKHTISGTGFFKPEMGITKQGS